MRQYTYFNSKEIIIMKQNEMQKLIVSGIIDGIILHRNDNSWFVMCHAVPALQPMLDTYGACLMTERGQQKTYTSLDRAFDALQALGWDGSLTIMP